jgi:hypothetical protein
VVALREVGDRFGHLVVVVAAVALFTWRMLEIAGRTLDHIEPGFGSAEDVRSGEAAMLHL